MHYKKIVQIVDYVPTFIEDKWSEDYASHLMDDFGTDNHQDYLEMEILEGSAIADYGKTLCQVCYTLEDNSLLIFHSKIGS